MKYKNSPKIGHPPSCSGGFHVTVQLSPKILIQFTFSGGDGLSI